MVGRIVTTSDAILQHRVNQQLEGDRGPATVPRGDRERGGVAATGTLAAHGDPASIHAERIRLRSEPAQRGVVVVQSGGKPPLGRQAIVYGNHNDIVVDSQSLQRLGIPAASNIT